MGLPKGKTNNPNGRKPGVPNKQTANMRERINTFLSDNWDGLQEEFKTLGPKEKFDFYIKLLSYSLPQLKSVEHKTDLKQTLETFSDEQLEKLITQILNENE